MPAWQFVSRALALMLILLMALALIAPATAQEDCTAKARIAITPTDGSEPFTLAKNTHVYQGIVDFHGLSIAVDGHLKDVGAIVPALLDCPDTPADPQYPRLIDKDGMAALDKAGFGMGFDDLPEKCPYIGDGGGVLSFSKAWLKSSGIPLKILCAVYRSGGVAFDPETGERLPSVTEYKGTGWQLRIPKCFAKAKLHMGQGYGSLQPVGCTMNFEPFSGRKLAPEEVAAFTADYTMSFDGGAGDLAIDDGTSKLDTTRRSTPAELDLLLQQLVKK